jgi:hypothetical protein
MAAEPARQGRAEPQDTARGDALAEDEAGVADVPVEHGDQHELWLDPAFETYDDGARVGDWRWRAADGGIGRVPQTEYAVDEYALDEDEDEDEDELLDDDEDEDAYEFGFPGALIEDPGRRGFFHHSSDDDHHRRRPRQREREPERNSMFNTAPAAMAAFSGLALFLILLVTIAIITGAAAIIKQDQQQNNRRHIPIPVPAPHPTKAKPPVEVPPVRQPKPKGAPKQPPVPVVPPLVPVPPIMVPPVAVPPVVPVPPGLPVPPGEVPPVVPPTKNPAPPRRPPARRPTRPPNRRPGPSRPPAKPRRPSRPPARQLPLCKNVNISSFDVGSFGSDIMDLDPAAILAQIVGMPADLVPGAKTFGIVGVCRPDSGGPAVAPGSPASTISYTNPGSGGKTGVTLDAVRRPAGHAGFTTDAVSSAPVSSAATGSSSGLLTSGQIQFAARLATDTGLNPQVIAAWLYQEENGSAAQARQQANNNDWLNIGYTDGGTFGTHDSVWSSPTTAADATAGWLKGEGTVPGYGGGSAGVQAILATAGKPALAQIAAIQSSGFAASGEPDLPIDYALFTGVALPNVGAGSVSLTSGGGGELTKQELVSRLPTLTQADFAHLTTQDLENALPQLEAALNGTSSAQTAAATGLGPAGAQRMLAAAEAVIGSGYNQGNHNAVSDNPAMIKQLGTDCSGFVSYLMGPNGTGLWSQSYTTVTIGQAPHIQSGPGPAQGVTIYNNPLPGNSGHVFIDIEGHWFEDAGGVGVHEMSAGEVKSYMQTGLYTQVFHPVGAGMTVA